MKDLIVNFIGAVVFSIIGYFYIKNRGKGRFAKRFIPRLKSKDADFLKKAVEEEEREEQALYLKKHQRTANLLKIQIKMPAVHNGSRRL